eukprot:368192_1
MAHIVDTALARRAAEGNPVKVAIIGAGFMARGCALQLEKYTEGMIVAAIYNRTVEKARVAYNEAGIEDPSVHEVKTAEELDDVVASGGRAICSD